MQLVRSGTVDVGGKTWEYYPVTLNEMGLPGGPVPISHYICFVDPEDPELRVEARNVPVEETVFDQSGLRRVYDRAKHRQWRSYDGILWEIDFHPPVAVRAVRHTDDYHVHPQPALIVFRAQGNSYHLRGHGIEPLGRQSDEALEKLLGAARSQA